MGEFNVNKTTGDLEQTAGADNEAKANRIDIAPDFDDTVAYAKGDLVYYQGTLYEFNQSHAAGAWNSAHADVKKISDILNSALFKRVSHTTSTAAAVTINAGATEDVEIDTFEQPAGYNYMSIFTYSCHKQGLVCGAIYFSSAKLYIRITNVTSSNITGVRPTIGVTYVKSNFITT